MALPKVVSQDEWQKAIDELRAEEKKLTINGEHGKYIY